MQGISSDPSRGIVQRAKVDHVQMPETALPTRARTDLHRIEHDTAQRVMCAQNPAKATSGVIWRLNVAGMVHAFPIGQNKAVHQKAICRHDCRPVGSRTIDAILISQRLTILPRPGGLKEPC